MDEALMRRAAAAAIAAGLGLGLAWPAAAQDLQDPTRPPATLAALTSAPTASGAASAGPQLQTILIGRAAGGRQLAVIDGETVQIGDTFRGARVTRIGDNEVELARGRERQVLRLYAQNAAGGITPAARAPSR
jgi:MSHA biogenesis protein MshK